MGDRLREAFIYVRETFFPRWDIERQWTVRLHDFAPYYSQSDPKTKTITLNYVSDKDDFLQRLLIHEICHIVTAQQHGKRWQERYLKAATKAKELGRKFLATLIAEDIELYTNPDKQAPMTPTDIYRRIEDIVLDAPTIQYQDLISRVAWDYGMIPREFLKRYKRCREVYDRIRRGAKEWSEYQEYLKSKKKGGDLDGSHCQRKG